MDPQKRSPLDAWASKHMSIASAASMDILGELPPPPPPKTSRPSSASSSANSTPKKKKSHKPTKELPPLPSVPAMNGGAGAGFDFKPPSIGSVQTHKAVVSPPPSIGSRSPPKSFDFECLDDHLRMAIYQIEAGSLEWAQFHINHARGQSLIGRFLWDVGANMGWWAKSPELCAPFGYLDQIDMRRLRELAGPPAPRLAVAFSSLVRYGEFFDNAATLMDAPMPQVPKRRGSIGKAAQAAASSGVPELPATPVKVVYHHMPRSTSKVSLVHSNSPQSIRTHTPEPRLSDIPRAVSTTSSSATATPSKVIPVKPFAKTHGRSDSNQSLNSAHMFPYPWRHSRNNSQSSVTSHVSHVSHA